MSDAKVRDGKPANHALVDDAVGNRNEAYPQVNRRRSIFCRRWPVILLISVLATLLNICFPQRAWLSGTDKFDFSNADWTYEIPSGVEVDTCVPAGAWAASHTNHGALPPTFMTSFDIPLSNNSNIFLLSRGWLSAGVVELVTSESQPDNTVTIHIAAEYYQERIRDLTKACIISRPGGGQGVGIFTPTWRGGHPENHRQEDTLRFLTKAVFPVSSETLVNSFETDVPNTSHFVGDSLSKVKFESIFLRSSNAPMNITRLAATRGSFHTSNGGIRGTFITSTSLSLVTSNAPISVRVELLNTSTVTQPSLEAFTTNAKLDARLRLTSPGKKGGVFKVVARTKNSPLFIRVSDAPLESTLSLEATTSNGAARVSLDPTYEGTFNVATSYWQNAEVNNLPCADPSGQGRLRTTQMQETYGHTKGTTAWGRHDDQRDGQVPKWGGSIDLQTSKASAVLNILGI